MAALATGLIFWKLQHVPVTILLAATLGVFVLGAYSATKLEPLWGEDSSRVVIDEVLGMMISLVAVPLNWLNILVAFVLFRFFDIAKPLGVRRMETLFKSGVAVMADDALAGIYSLVVMQVLLAAKVL